VISRTTIVAALVIAGAATANAQQRVTVTGCPINGIAPRCIIIRGPDNTTYNITDARQRPEIGTRAITVTGIRVNRNHYCKQGVVLANVTWTYTNQNCR